jgi:carboxyl-terminal processing protease
MGTGAEAGLTIQIVEGRSMVTRVDPGYPAAVAGIRPGFVVTRIGKTKTAELWTQVQKRKELFLNKGFIFSRIVGRLVHGTLNQVVELSCIDGSNKEKTYRLSLKKVQGQLLKFGELPTFAGFVESKRLPGKIGYVRLTVFMMPLLEKMKAVMASFHSEKAMIIDLRQNPGGFGAMAIPIAGQLVSKRMSLGSMKMRVGETRMIVYPQPNAFKGPVAILTDEGSASTSEILAGGLQEAGRVVVIGQTTTGAVLPSMIERLPDGSRLQYAIADYRTPKGLLLEGRGVIPDYPVHLTRNGLLKQVDPVMVKAQSVLKKLATLNSHRP